MFNEFVILHSPPAIPEPQNDKNALSVEKMTQTGEGIWQVSGFFSVSTSIFFYADRKLGWKGKVLSEMKKSYKKSRAGKF